jgi:hypothetical protein
MFECNKCGARLSKKYDVHSPKPVHIGQPFIPCDGVLVEVNGNVILDGFPIESFDRAARLDLGLASRDEIFGQFRAR